MARSRRRRLLSDPNLTNLMDVVFVLLIIFMITAPMMTQGVQVELPTADAPNVEVNDFLQVSVNKKTEIYINHERVSLLDFRKRFTEVFAGRASMPVFVSGDKSVPYGLMLRVIADIQKAGVAKLGFLSEPLPDESRR